MGVFWGCVVIAVVLYACGCEIEKGFNKIAAVIAEISKLLHNSDYEAALRVYKEWGESKYCQDHVSFPMFVSQRLNALKAGHCA